MNTAARNIMVAAALFLSGGLLAMTLNPASSADTSAISAVWNTQPTNSFDLGANVDWTKVRQEPKSPTF
jgi:hypothetical protein